MKFEHYPIKFENHPHISKYTLKKVKKGATTVDLLTDWKTPCFIYQIEPEIIKSGIIRSIDTTLIAVNNGIGTYAETSNQTHIFCKSAKILYDSVNKNNFTIPYLSNKKIVLYSRIIRPRYHSEKQLRDNFFSRLFIGGNFEDLVNEIVKEFTDKGYKLIHFDDLEYFKRMNLYYEFKDEQDKKIRFLGKRVRKFYKSH